MSCGYYPTSSSEDSVVQRQTYYSRPAGSIKARVSSTSPSASGCGGVAVCSCESYGVLGCWRGPLRFLEVPVSLVGPMLGRMCDWAFVDGRGSHLGAGRTPLVGADAPAASGSRSWCHRRGGRARPWRPARGRWRGRRRAAARTAPAEPRAVGPSPSRARSPLNQRIEHTFEMDRERCVVRQGLGGPRSGGNSADPGRRQRSRRLSAGCQQRFHARPRVPPRRSVPRRR